MGVAAGLIAVAVAVVVLGRTDAVDSTPLTPLPDVGVLADVGELVTSGELRPGQELRIEHGADMCEIPVLTVEAPESSEPQSYISRASHDTTRIDRPVRLREGDVFRMRLPDDSVPGVYRLTYWCPTDTGQPRGGSTMIVISDSGPASDPVDPLNTPNRFCRFGDPGSDAEKHCARWFRTSMPLPCRWTSNGISTHTGEPESVLDDCEQWEAMLPPDIGRPGHN